MLRKIINGLVEHNEEFFKYFNVHDGYDVSFNFIDAGADIPSHIHEKEVFNYVLEGELEVTIAAVKKTFKQGEWINIEAGVPHSVKTNVKATLLELWKK